MIPSTIYIGFPTIIGFVFVLVLTFLFFSGLRTETQIRNSLYLAGLQSLVASFAAALTIKNSISTLAFMTGIVGSIAGPIVGIIDLGVLIWWIAKRRGPSCSVSAALVFILLRLFSHVCLTFQFVWCALLCTV
jgi:hypothetical protein